MSDVNLDDCAIVNATIQDNTSWISTLLRQRDFFVQSRDRHSGYVILPFNNYLTILG